MYNGYVEATTRSLWHKCKIERLFGEVYIGANYLYLYDCRASTIKIYRVTTEIRLRSLKSGNDTLDRSLVRFRMVFGARAHAHAHGARVLYPVNGNESASKSCKNIPSTGHTTLGIIPSIIPDTPYP